MKSLDQFAGYQEVFKDAKALPPFFETNLVDPARVVKFFENDPQAEIRIFYYQYLKLCFQLENVNYDLYIRKIEQIINNPDFQFIFYSSDDSSIFNDTQAKSLIMEFFGVLGEGNYNVLQCLTKFPILDKIFIHFFRSLMILSNIIDSLDSYIERDTLLNFLCKTFEVQAEVHGQCIRYSETDIFIYELNNRAVYMAYMDYDNYNNSAQQSPQINQYVQPTTTPQVQVQVPPFHYQQPQLTAPLPEINRKDNLAKDSYIADQFVDFTSNATALTSKAKTILKSSQSEIQVQPKLQAPRQMFPVKQVPKQVNVQIKPDISRNFNNANLIETKSIPYSSDSYLTSKSEFKVDTWQPPYLSSLAQTTKTAQVQPDSSIKYSATQSNLQSFDMPLYPQTVPTKDSTFNQIQKQQIQIQPLPQPQLQPLPQQKQQVQLQKYSIDPKPTKNDLIYNPKLENPSFNIAAYLNPKVEQTSKDLKSVTTYGANVPTKKKPYGLNISQEFTNSQISKHMAEPHRSNVQNIKVRQRNFRSSLQNVVK